MQPKSRLPYALSFSWTKAVVFAVYFFFAQAFGETSRRQGA
jgi:hypothetical protein